jgi:predicted GNAT family N-acyltransferase
MSVRFTVRILDWADARPLARPIREEVFVREQKVPLEIEWDEWDERSDHAVARAAEGRAIGTGRLLPDGQIGRMAVLKDWRGKGVGAALLLALLDRARDRAMPRALLHAQVQAAGFYRRFGFSERGGEFVEAGIPHVKMALELTPRRGSADS